MYVINVVSKLPIVPENLREMFKGNLEWIGRVMGVGQAALLADVRSSLRSRRARKKGMKANMIAFLAIVFISQRIYDGWPCPSLGRDAYFAK